jgi:hypothetical protein
MDAMYYLSQQELLATYLKGLFMTTLIRISKKRALRDRCPVNLSPQDYKSLSADNNDREAYQSSLFYELGL